VEVQVAKVGREDLQAKVSANGKVQAQRKVDISAKLDQEALIRIDAYPNRTFHCVVTEVGSSPIVKQNAGQSEAIKFKVKIQIGAQEGRVAIPGLDGDSLKPCPSPSC